MRKIKFGVLTISDRCAKNEAVDSSGENLISMIKNGVVENGEVAEVALVPDDMSKIESVLKDWCDRKKVEVILTTGGTGIAGTDVTPEATAPLLDKEIPGISNLIFKHSSEVTPLAALSRGTAGVRNKTLIVNFPGSEKASRQCLEFIAPVIPHAVDLILDVKSEVRSVHSALKSRKSKVSLRVADRPRCSTYPCLAVEEAQEIITTRVHLVRREKFVGFENALGFVLAQDVAARESLPPFDASLKDGYAVISGDGKVEKMVVKLSSDESLASGCCVRINTGDPIPKGADAVVQVEDTTVVLTSDDDWEEVVIRVKKMPNKGQDIRPKGFDYKRGENLLKSGTYLEAAAVGLLASAGATIVRVCDKPVVGILSTGNELVSPEMELPLGKVRDSNRITLLSLLKEEGFPGLDLGIVQDDPDAVLNALEKGFRASDIVVTTGNMSMGDKDVLKDILVDDFEAEMCFGRVLMKPGKPTAFAVLNFEGKPKLWFGLPGNPASSMVTAVLFLLPALRKISGFSDVFPKAVRVPLDRDIPPEDRPQYCRAKLSYSAGWVATPTGDQSSSRISSCIGANSLLVIPANHQEAHTERDDQKQFFKGICAPFNQNLYSNHTELNSTRPTENHPKSVTALLLKKNYF